MNGNHATPHETRRYATIDRSLTRSPWRIETPLRALERLGNDLTILDASVTPDELPDVDILVIHNPSSQAEVDLIRGARERGIAVIIDVDDLLRPGLLPAQAKFNRYWAPDRFRREAEAKVRAVLADQSIVDAAPRNDALTHLEHAIQAANALTVATLELAQAYADLTPSIYVLPNCYDDANPLWDVALPERETINIGFLGTEHHGPNLDLLAGAIEPVLDRFSHVRVIEAGQGGLLSRIDAPAERLIQIGWLPFSVFPLVLHQMDIVLAPLVDEPFMRAKSNIRCMTAGLVGAPVVASPVGPYAGYVEHGRNGFFATTPSEWTEHLTTLVADPVLRREIGESNRDCARRYAISANIDRWRAVHDAVLDRHRCA